MTAIRRETLTHKWKEIWLENVWRFVSNIIVVKAGRECLTSALPFSRAKSTAFILLHEKTHEKEAKREI